MRFRIHTFQACSFDHSDTSPGLRSLAGHGASAMPGRAAIRSSRIPAHALAATVAPFRAWRGSQPDVAGGPDWTAIDPAIREAQSSGSRWARTGGGVLPRSDGQFEGKMPQRIRPRSEAPLEACAVRNAVGNERVPPERGRPALELATPTQFTRPKKRPALPIEGKMPSLQRTLLRGEPPAQGLRRSGCRRQRAGCPGARASRPRTGRSNTVHPPQRHRAFPIEGKMPSLRRTPLRSEPPRSGSVCGGLAWATVLASGVGELCTVRWIGRG